MIYRRSFLDPQNWKNLKFLSILSVWDFYQTPAVAQAGVSFFRKIKLKNVYDPKTAGGCGVAPILSCERLFHVCTNGACIWLITFVLNGCCKASQTVNAITGIPVISAVSIGRREGREKVIFHQFLDYGVACRQRYFSGQKANRCFWHIPRW